MRFCLSLSFWQFFGFSHILKYQKQKTEHSKKLQHCLGEMIFPQLKTCNFRTNQVAPKLFLMKNHWNHVSTEVIILQHQLHHNYNLETCFNLLFTIISRLLFIMLNFYISFILFGQILYKKILCTKLC